MAVAGSGASVKVEGLAELQRKLSKLDKGLTTEVKAVNKEAALLVAAEVRSRAPVGSGRDKHPGRLRNSVRAGATRMAGVVRIGGGLVAYAKPIIFGWPKRHIKPQPFPYHGLDVRRHEVVALYEKRIVEIERKAFP